MMEESDIPQESRRKWPRRLVLAAFLVLLAVPCFDYVVFQSREESILAISTQLGGHPFSIGGWPFGEEHLIVFSRPLTNNELQQLATLDPIHQSGRHAIRVSFKNCSLSEKRLAEVREILHNIVITAEVSNQQEPAR
jgi:hypothetical protein